MKVILSGLNLDIETISDLQNFIRRVATNLDEGFFNGLDPVTKNETLHQLYQEATELLARDNLTPETISAAYARISRNPKPVNELREIARQEVDRARKSNQNIIFGLGHSSVAEHATFNFDIIGASRFAVETIEHFRLASYTEKSQRYILFEDDFIVPEELKNTQFVEEYNSLIREQNQVYFQLYDILKPYFFEHHKLLAKDSKNHRMLEGLAKEDARYVISLATQTQLGMTVNARTLENMIAKCNSHHLSEVNEYARLLYEATKNYAPSIVKYVEPTSYLKDKKRSLLAYTQELNTNFSGDEKTLSTAALIDFPADIDDKILATALFRLSENSYNKCVQKVKLLSESEKENFFKVMFRDMNSWDSVLREFEFASFTFQLVVSASNFGQLKRHRMANIITQDYSPNLGITIPESIVQTGQKNIFLDTIEKTNKFYWKLYKQFPELAPYVLTNAHRRRVLFKINMRELYHFLRMREDKHAQWDIRKTAEDIHNIIRKEIIWAGALLGGKNQFSVIYNNFFYQ
jgi:flavin-dependent thymidylate synthase